MDGGRYLCTQLVDSVAPWSEKVAMRMAPLVFIGLSLVSCSDGEDALDTLPKRGERTTDPTIVSAAAGCSGELMFKGLVVRIDATDSTAANLGTCAAAFDGATALGTFVETTSRCVAQLTRDCVVETDYVVDLTISNKTGGVTTASVKLRAVP